MAMAAPSSSSPRRRRTALIIPLLLLVSLLFLLSVVVAGRDAARVVAAAVDDEASSRSMQEQYRDVVYEETKQATTSFARGDTDERCGGRGTAGGGGEGIEDEAECLMRRTLVAHTDYIYTQGGGHN